MIQKSLIFVFVFNWSKIFSRIFVNRIDKIRFFRNEFKGNLESEYLQVSDKNHN